jgi:hypothetical protein
VINPVHADELEILDLLGYWPLFETWERELVTLTTDSAKVTGSQPIQLWDFTGYDSYTTEAVSVGRSVLQWFWEPAHYTRALGNLIVMRIFGQGDDHFGVLLSPANIEAHLADIREERRLYREQHRADAQRIHKLYDFVVRSQNSVSTTGALSRR